ncbi:tetratricopeptide repeat protein [Polaribacter sp. Hel_I_88]|uniref:tetratricopeptide repeat protein n=1 Tax=Polaribacter sp. Hel_I_88 TaxID=1250006 RepID=UPI00047D6DE0|nr:tetratricopeptide repeat protein [Polaribacter sp. Hel_I_88]
MNIFSNRFPISVFTLLTQLILLISFVGCQNSKTSNKELIKIPNDVDSLYILAKETKNDSLLNLALKSYIKTYYRKQDWKPFHEYLKEHLSLTSRIGDTTSYARTLEYKAGYFNKQNEIDSAYYYYAQSLKLYKATQDSLNIGFGLLNIAIIQKNFRDYPRSIHNLKQSLLFMEGKASARRISSSYNTLGINFNYMNAYDSALVYHKKSKELRETIKNQAYLIQSLNNIGKVYEDKGNYTIALDYYERALSYDSIIIEYPKTRATLIDNRAHSLFLLDKNKNSIEEDFLAALAIRDSLDDAYGKTVSYIHLAKFYGFQNNSRKAKYYTRQAEAIAKNINDHQNHLETLELQILLFDGEDKQRALNYYKHIRDSLDFGDKTKLESLYDVEEKVSTSKSIIDTQKKEIILLKESKWWIMLFVLFIIVLFATIVNYINNKKRKKEKELDRIKESALQMVYRGKVEPQAEEFHNYLEETFNLNKNPALFQFLILRGAGKSEREIADISDVSIGAIEKRRNRLIKHLKKLLDISPNDFFSIKDFYNIELKKFRKENNKNLTDQK